MFSRVFQWYSRQLVQRPYTTQIVSACALWSGGDLLNQKLVERRPDMDWRRVASSAAYGAAIAGPLYCWWYAFLDRRASPLLSGPAGSLGKYIAAKIAADQLIFEPINLSIYFMTTATLEGRMPRAAWADFKSKFAELFATDTAIWPLAQYINFRYLPLPYQALYVNTVSLGWAVLLSFLAHRNDHSHAALPTPISASISASTLLDQPNTAAPDATSPILHQQDLKATK